MSSRRLSICLILLTTLRHASSTEPYTANVTSLTIRSESAQIASPVYTNTPVDIVCTWDAGNPPVRATLLDRHGVEMEGTVTSDGPLIQISYRFAAVGCQDAGLIRCQAPGASHNKTATLLVRCVPEIRLVHFEETPTNTLHLKFEVRSHTSSLQCKIQTWTTQVKYSMFAMAGYPPDLTAIVRLDNVKKQDQQKWHLTLTNDVGPGFLEFTELVSTAVATNITTRSASFDRNVSDAVIIAVVVVLAAVVVVGFISFTFIYLRKGSRTHGGTRPSRQEAEAANVNMQEEPSNQPPNLPVRYREHSRERAYIYPEYRVRCQ